MRVECDVAARHITILECRPPWDESGETEWSRFPIARMSFTKKTGLWTLFWRDRKRASRPVRLELFIFWWRVRPG
ncbi:DUF3024 domain-containing protein [Arthrobacter liuii]|uniref:DUF3024 domain-containing protein n=1 Tax=Arthrobacter liuii TaxID=1476996 RepID=UPI003570F3C7